MKSGQYKKYINTAVENGGEILYRYEACSNTSPRVNIYIHQTGNWNDDKASRSSLIHQLIVEVVRMSFLSLSTNVDFLRVDFLGV